jgi:hypothetical protein
MSSSTSYPAIMGDKDRQPHGAFFTVGQIKQANRDAGQHYFEPDTMRFFKSRVMDFVTGGRFFVTSEQNGYNAPRMWSVREAMPDGSIESYSEFQEYSSGAAAKRAAKQARRIGTPTTSTASTARPAGRSSTSSRAPSTRGTQWSGCTRTSASATWAAHRTTCSTASTPTATSSSRPASPLERISAPRRYQRPGP